MLNVPFYTSAVFKTFLLRVRIPRFPMVTAGYYPATQLSVLDDRRIAEGYYNTFTASVSHPYRFKNITFTSSATYVRFFTGSTDTGFLYRGAKSVSISQHAFIKRFSFQLAYSESVQAELGIKTITHQTTWQVKKHFSVSAGLKRVRVNKTETCLGKSAAVQFNILKLGQVGFNYEQNYLPGRGGRLLPVDFGRLIYTRVFK